MSVGFVDIGENYWPWSITVTMEIKVKEQG
jgi:hypothetical protein